MKNQNPSPNIRELIDSLSESVSPTATVWRYPTGWYYVGEPDPDDDCEDTGTVAEWRQHFRDADESIEKDSRQSE